MITWEQNHVFLSKGLKLIHRHRKHWLNWKAKDKTENVNFSILEKIRVNLIGCSALLGMVNRQPIFFVPMALVMRTIVSDIIIYRYFKTVRKIGGLKAYEIEMNVLNCQYASGIRDIYEVLKKINPSEADEIDKAFQANFLEYILPTGKIKDHRHFRTDPGFNDAVKKFKEQNNIKPDLRTEKEGGKLRFTIEKGKEDIEFLYGYFAQYHHFTERASNFYKDPEFRKMNREYSAVLIHLALLTCLEIHYNLTPNNPLIKRMDKLLANQKEIMQKYRHRDPRPKRKYKRERTIILHGD